LGSSGKRRPFGTGDHFTIGTAPLAAELGTTWGQEPTATNRHRELAPDLRPSLTQKLQTPLGVHSQKGIDDGKKVCRYCGGTRKADLRLGIRDFWVN
jgi:hypothetical protein